MSKKLTGEDPTPRQYIESLLPKHYIVTEGVSGCIYCKSKDGIEDDEEWEHFMDSVRGYFGDAFKEVYHSTCTYHLNFTVYYDYYKLNNIDYEHKLLKSPSTPQGGDKTIK